MHKYDGELLQNKSDYERLRLLENKTQFSLKKMRELFLPIEKSSTPTAYVPTAGPHQREAMGRSTPPTCVRFN